MFILYLINKKNFIYLIFFDFFLLVAFSLLNFFMELHGYFILIAEFSMAEPVKYSILRIVF